MEQDALNPDSQLLNTQSVDLKKVFKLQETFMRRLHDRGKFADWPVDLTTKSGQAIVKQIIFDAVAELFEASFTLKNRQHRITNDTVVDLPYFKEELSDAFAFFVELCIVCGISADEIVAEYVRKNKIVTERLENGY